MPHDEVRAHKLHNSILDSTGYQSKNHKILEPFLQKPNLLVARVGIESLVHPSLIATSPASFVYLKTPPLGEKFHEFPCSDLD